MSIKKLDEFLQDKKEIKYQIGDKVIIGDTSAKSLLRIMSKAQGVEDMADQIDIVFDIVFGKENSKLLSESLTAEGLMKVINEINTALGIDNEEVKK